MSDKWVIKVSELVEKFYEAVKRARNERNQCFIDTGRDKDQEWKGKN